MAPEDPVEIEMDAEIERSAQDVYAMVNFADSRHHKAEVGVITRTGDATYEMVVDMLPDLTFTVRELEAVPNRSYSFESPLPTELGARLMKTVESYRIESLGPDRCKVTATTLAHFHPMKLKHYQEEITRIAVACNNSINKLKIHAEQGADTIREIEARQVA
ncbi:hypothetical protein [Aurantiacibacter zhengii]|uniref:Uncharacterized protein n=1 Tax=Aurantiacibacter zhengii TaxID=2307003 RepID=A0A418NP43_9SPHN|nr:hypothetical protein [Aurantiacibacter zhengii]RIV83867.1 hypothetical protein D2V07_15390 [Aurantiacibacter zhengii]